MATSSHNYSERRLSYKKGRTGSVHQDLNSKTLTSSSSFHTLYPSSQLIHRHPLVKKHPTARRATWGIHPSIRSCRITASIQGNPVQPWWTIWQQHMSRIIILHLQNLLHLKIQRWECKTIESHLLPSLQPFSIFFPRKLNNERVVLHLMQARIASSHQKEELSEKQRFIKWRRRHYPLYLLKKKTNKTRNKLVPDRKFSGHATTFRTHSQFDNNVGKANI